MAHKIEYRDGQATQVDAPQAGDDLIVRPLTPPAEPQRKRSFEIPSLLQSASIAALAFAAYFAWEALAPYPVKFSTLIGSHDAAMAQLLKEAEIREEAKLKDYVLAAELHNQYAIQYYKVASESIIGYTNTLYDARKIALEHKARQEQQAQGALIAQAQAENAADMSMGTMSKLFGLGVGIFAPDMGSAMTEYGNGLHSEARSRLAAVAQQNHEVSMEGWNMNVPPPDYVQKQLQLIAPMPLPPRPEFKHYRLPEPIKAPEPVRAEETAEAE